MRFVFLAAAASVILGSGITSVKCANAQEAPAMNGITVQGTGEVKYTPDIARITLGVQTQNIDSEKAAQENATKTDALIRAIKAVGVVEKDIQTANYSVSPQYKYTNPNDPGYVPGGNNAPVLTGYMVQNSVCVVVRAIKNTGRVIDAARKAGANMAGGIDFDLNDADMQKTHDEALARAVLDAKRKAGVIAKASELGRITVFNITEGGINIVRPYGNPVMTMRADAATTPIAAGEQAVSATVTVRYLFFPGTPANY